MKSSTIRIVGGTLLIVFGTLALLSSLGIVVGGIDLFWALLLGAGGALFLYVFLTNRDNWWAIIPGFVLVGVAATIILELFFPRTGVDWGGMLIVGGIGCAFWAIYFIKREHWWAIIPGGVMLTLAVMVGLTPALESAGIDTGGFFLIGLGLTFGLLAMLPASREQMKWALIPAAVLLVIGLLVTAAAAELLQLVGPVVLILVGLYLIFRVFRQR
jgi:hypothetical protein